MRTASRDCPFRVSTFEQIGHIDPRVVVKRAIVVATKKMVQVNIEEPISRNNPPPQHIWILFATNDEIGIARSGEARVPTLSWTASIPTLSTSGIWPSKMFISHHL